MVRSQPRDCLIDTNIITTTIDPYQYVVPNGMSLTLPRDARHSYATQRRRQLRHGIIKDANNLALLQLSTAQLCAQLIY